MRELTSRRYRYLSDGRMKLETKEEMRKKGLKSPDWGDAIAMAYAGVKERPKINVRPVMDLTSASRWRR